MNRIDTRNKPCPKPVLMTRDALENDGLPLEILVDKGAAVLNVKRFLESRNLSVSIIEDRDAVTLVCETEGGAFEETEPSVIRERQGNTAFVICSSVLGHSDEQLGEVLIKGFLDALAAIAEPPSAIALMNEGVKLALPENSTSESLQILEKKGCRILVCGTCTKHFGITGPISAGTISNMFEITEVMMDHPNTIVLG